MAEAGAVDTAPKPVPDVVKGPDTAGGGKPEGLGAKVLGSDGENAPRPSDVAPKLTNLLDGGTPPGDILHDLAEGSIKGSDSAEDTGPATEAPKAESGEPTSVDASAKTKTEPQAVTPEPIPAGTRFDGTVIDSATGATVTDGDKNRNATETPPAADTKRPAETAAPEPAVDTKDTSKTSSKAPEPPPTAAPDKPVSTAPDAPDGSEPPPAPPSPEPAAPATPEANKENQLSMNELIDYAKRLAQEQKQEAEDNENNEDNLDAADKFNDIVYTLQHTSTAIDAKGTGTPFDRDDHRPEPGESLADFYDRTAKTYAEEADKSDTLDHMKSYYKAESARLAGVSEFVKDAQTKPDEVKTKLASTSPDTAKPDQPDAPKPPEAADSGEGVTPEKTPAERRKEAEVKLAALNIKLDSKAKKELLDAAEADPEKMDQLEAVIEMTQAKVEDVMDLVEKQLSPEAIARISTKEFNSLVDLLKTAGEGIDPNSPEGKKMHWMLKVLIGLGIAVAIPIGLTGVALSQASQISGQK